MAPRRLPCECGERCDEKCRRRQASRRGRETREGREYHRSFTERYQKDPENDERRAAAKSRWIEKMKGGRCTGEWGCKCGYHASEAARPRKVRAPEKIREAHENNLRKLRSEFLEAYGGKCQGPASGGGCPWGVTDERVLTMAHLNGDGGERRKASGGHNMKEMRELRKAGWPQDRGIGIQCGNCQILDHRLLVKQKAKDKQRVKEAA